MIGIEIFYSEDIERLDRQLAVPRSYERQCCSLLMRGRRQCCGRVRLVMVSTARRLRELRVSGRRFPAPWSVRELEQAFRIEDATGQAVAYTYFRKDENEARQAQVLTHDEARRVAANIAKLPELLSRKGEE